MAVCYLGIGSNLGDRRQNIRIAVNKVNLLKGTKVIKLSRVIETLPVGGPKGQGKYLNAAMKIQTMLSPLLLLKKLKSIEKELGRVKALRFGPRPIDLDILLYEGKIIKTKMLTVPHPRMFKRDFVLKTLTQVL